VCNEWNESEDILIFSLTFKELLTHNLFLRPGLELETNFFTLVYGQSQVNSNEIYGGQSGSGSFPTIIIIPPVLHTHLSLPHEG
jgi:hypothetical protein